MDTHSRTQELIVRYLERLATADELAELQQLIVRDPCAADAFADATRVDATLAEIFNQPASHSGTHEWLDRAGDGSLGRGAARDTIASPNARHESRPYAGRVSMPWLTAIAGGMLAIAAAAWWMSLPAHVEQEAGSRPLAQSDTSVDETPTAVPDPNDFGFAKVTRMIGADMTHAGLAATLGDRIRHGAYQLVSGLVEITFDHGPEVILEAPCEFDVKTRDLLLLSRGRVSAKVPKDSGDFTIETPSATIVDLGTEFGVQVNRDSDSEVHVFDGKVEVVPRTESESFPAVLLANGASSIDKKTATPCGIDIDPGRFLRELNEPDSDYSRLIREWKPAAYYRMAPIGNMIEDRGAGGIDGFIVRGNPEGSPWAAGKVGSSLQLRGPAYKDYAVIPDYPKTTNGTLSFTAWVYANSRPRSATIAKNWAGDEHGQFHFGLHYDDGDIEIYISDGEGKEIFTREGKALPIGQWHHVAFVADGAMLRLYRNGVEVAANPYSGISGDPSLKVMGIGVKLNPTGSEPDILRFKDNDPRISDYWHGRIDEVALFNRPLTPEQIVQLYRAVE